MVAQFAAETTNSEKALYFLSLMSCLIKKLKYHMLFRFYVDKDFFAPGNGGGGGGGGGYVHFCGNKCKQSSAQYHQKFCASIS